MRDQTARIAQSITPELTCHLRKKAAYSKHGLRHDKYPTA
jgi:hypothetical protein